MNEVLEQLTWWWSRLMGVLRFIWPPQGSYLCAPDGGRLREDGKSRGRDGTGDGLERLP